MGLEIFFRDLTPEKQQEALDYMVVESPKDLNWDVVPLFEIEADFRDEDDCLACRVGLEGICLRLTPHKD